MLSINAATALAWGPEGHSVIGILALSQLQPVARQKLENIFGPLDEQVMVKACNWPDEVRETEEWKWSAPQHYVNIPRGNFTYLESRDCPDQLCATQAIKRYAAELADRGATSEQRWQAFAWLCHVVGDLHQPLHAGFADDRGGNDFEVIFNGERINLHTFWDHALIKQRADSWQNLVEQIKTSPLAQPDSKWSPERVNDWTDESHKLDGQMVYPPTPDIDESFEWRSWKLVQQRIRTAASRLAWIINSELDTGKQ